MADKLGRINIYRLLDASVVGGSIRFFIVAGLMGLKGEKIRPFVEKYFNLLSLSFVALLIGELLVVK